MTVLRTNYEGLPQAPTLAALYGDCEEDWFADLLSSHLLTPAADMSSRPSKKIRAHLVALGYHAVVGQEFRSTAEQFQIERAGQAIELLHAGSLMVDDFQDQSISRRGAPASHIKHGVSRTINSANWLYFWPLRLLQGTGLSPDQESTLRDAYLLALERAHTGQALDLGIDMTTIAPERWAAVVDETTRLKTASITELAMTMGAVIAESEHHALLGKIGCEFGVLLQRLDDLGNLFATQNQDKVCEDLGHRKPTWVFPVAHEIGLATELIACIDEPETLPQWTQWETILDHGLSLIEQHKEDLYKLCRELPDSSLLTSLKALEGRLFHAYLNHK